MRRDIHDANILNEPQGTVLEEGREIKDKQQQEIKRKSGHERNDLNIIFNGVCLMA